jgi:tRNA pseudouridine55 synthase
VRQAAARFVGAIQQRPPAFSAMKIGGRRAYKLARAGTTVEMQPRTVMVYSLDVLDYAWPLARLRVECGRGTYIRAIARDLGEALGVAGYLTELRRTFIGRFRVADAVSFEKISVDGFAPHLHLIE